MALKLIRSAVSETGIYKAVLHNSDDVAGTASYQNLKYRSFKSHMRKKPAM